MLINTPKLRLLLTSLMLMVLVSCQQSRLEAHQEGIDLAALTVLALRGELSELFKILQAYSDHQLSDEAKQFKSQYYQRFKSEKQHYQYNTTDHRMIELVDAFHHYWQSVMLDELPLATADEQFEQTMVNYLIKHKPAMVPESTALQDDLYRHLNDFVRAAGFYSNAYGKTGHLYDLFLWQEQQKQIYPIELIDEAVEVPVYFMSDFISTGWSHYATFGKSYASGWATKQALYAVTDAYDQNSEKFTVSYLAHEGQHFVDYKHFPQLQQADLEYRAKLVELVLSKQTTYQLLDKFTQHAKNDPNNAHAFANYKLVSNLSALLFGTPDEKDRLPWKKINHVSIKQQSLKLYQQHTAALMALGSETVTEFLPSLLPQKSAQ